MGGVTDQTQNTHDKVGSFSLLDASAVSDREAAVLSERKNAWRLYPEPDFSSLKSETVRHVINEFINKWRHYNWFVLSPGSSYKPVSGCVALHANYIKFLLKAFLPIYRNYQGKDNDRGSILFSVHRHLVVAIKNMGIAAENLEELRQIYEDAALIIDIAIKHEPFLEERYSKEIDQYLSLAVKVYDDKADLGRINKENELNRICQRLIDDLDPQKPDEEMLIKYFREYQQKYYAKYSKDIGSTPTAVFVKKHPELAVTNQVRVKSSSDSPRLVSESKKVKSSVEISSTAKMFSFIKTKVKGLIPASSGNTVAHVMSTPKLGRVNADENEMPNFLSSPIADKNKTPDQLRRRHISVQEQFSDTEPLLSR